MRRRVPLLILAIVVAAAVTVGWRLRPGTAPEGQPPLGTLDAAALDAVRADFNRYADQPRVIVLLSPT